MSKNTLIEKFKFPVNVLVSDNDELPSDWAESMLNGYLPFDPTLADKHLKKMLRHYKIKVVQWSKGSNGWANIYKKKIKIPHPTNIDRFCVAMHELGHVINGACKRTMKLYKSEFIAEMFAIEQAALFNWDATQYKERARRYIIMNVAKGHCRHLNLDIVEQEVIDFCGIDFKSWKGKKVFVSGFGTDVYKGKPLEIKIEL